MIELYKIATCFRDAIEKAVMAGEIREMQSFPSGCCSYASDLLQRYLFEEYNIRTYYMSGKYGYDENGESHAWLEFQDHLVIDITGDQYKNKKLKFTQQVYVGTRENGFHDKFELDVPIAYIEGENMPGNNLFFDKRYEAVLRHIREAHG